MAIYKLVKSIFKEEVFEKFGNGKQKETIPLLMI